MENAPSLGSSERENAQRGIAYWLPDNAGEFGARFRAHGAVQSWMQPSNDFRLPSDWLYGGQDDVGGPMWISNGFRWNVPVVTYGFDQSFLNFFGSNGVAAVEGAIQLSQ